MTITAPDPAAVLAGDTTPLHHPSATDEQRALLEWAEANPAPARSTVPLDAKGERYRTHAPGTDKERSYTRVTTYSSSLDDGGGLVRWRNRLLARGITATDAIVAAARRAGDDTRALDGTIAAALHAAGEKLAADLGTAFHLAMEHATTGSGIRPPAPYDRDVEATLAAMAAAGLEVRLTEMQLWNPTCQTIGTGDVAAAGPWGEKLRFADYKTGSRADRLGYAIQQAIYAHSTHRWDGGTWVPAEFDTDVAYLVHTPLGSGTCELIEVALAPAWNLARLCGQVRDARRSSTAKALFPAPTDSVPPMPAPADGAQNPLHAEREAWLAERLQAITDPNHRAEIVRHWPDGAGAKPPWTPEQIDFLSALIAPLEPGFPAADPAAPPVPTAWTAPAEPDPATLGPRHWEVADDGAKPSEEAEALVVAAFDALTTPQRDLLATWVRDARTSGRHIALGPDKRTARTVACQHAAVACLTHLWDDDTPEYLTRLALARLHDRSLDAGWHTGALIGALTLSQASDLAQTAEAYGRSDTDVVALMGRLVADDIAAG